MHAYKKQRWSFLGLLLSCSLVFAMELPENPGQIPVQIDAGPAHQVIPQSQSLWQKMSAGVRQLQNSNFVCYTIPAAITAGVLAYYAPQGNLGGDMVRKHTLATAVSFLALSEGARLGGTLIKGITERYTRNTASLAANTEENATDNSYCAACHKEGTQTSPTMLIPCANKHQQHYHPICLVLALNMNNNTCPVCHEHMTIVPSATAPYQSSQIKNCLKTGADIALLIIISKLDFLKDRQDSEWMRWLNIPQEVSKWLIQKTTLDTTALNALNTIAQKLHLSPAAARAFSCSALVLIDHLLSKIKGRIIFAAFGDGHIARFAEGAIQTPTQYCLETELPSYALLIGSFSTSFQKAMAKNSLPLTIIVNAISLTNPSRIDHAISPQNQTILTQIMAAAIEFPFLVHPAYEKLSDAINNQIYIFLLTTARHAPEISANTPQVAEITQATQTEEDPVACVICFEGNPQPAQETETTLTHAGSLINTANMNPAVQMLVQTVQGQIETALANNAAQTATGDNGQPEEMHALVVIPCAHYHPERIHPECLMGMQESGRTFKCPLCRAPFATKFGLTNASATETASTSEQE
ncbi:hypothetical protein, partial [Methylicorpusculum sp.]|uniref:hypothetical protein n=1 Tax=Methylicorpusculum sp. TaxID=2713644 RepID=UPI002ABA5CAE